MSNKLIIKFENPRNYCCGEKGEFVTLDQAETLAMQGFEINVLAKTEILEKLFECIPVKAKALNRFVNCCAATSVDITTEDIEDIEELGAYHARKLEHCASGKQIWALPGIKLPAATIHGKTTGGRNETAEKRVKIAFAAVRKFLSENE